MTDESKAESLYAVLVWIGICIVLVTAPTWAPLIDDAMEPKPVLVECKRRG